MKRCIFYLPYKLIEHGKGARMMRPKKMIQAFREIGYDVYVIEGFSAERKDKIRKLKNNIREGRKNEFMYAESSTMPTILTDPNHLPLHPFMDYSFFKYVKKQGISIGLFYCDIYWKFDSYKTEVKGLKRCIALKSYFYDIKKYETLLDRFYLPDKKMLDYINSDKLTKIAEVLPPGSDDIPIISEKIENRDFSTNPLHIFYVGGINNYYKMEKFVAAVAKTDNCILTICCRENEWSKEKHNYEQYLNDHIRIIHKNSDELEPYYQQSDICSLMFERDEYRDFMMPYKAFEYLAYELPVVSTKGTAISRFVEENNTGWTLPYSVEDICFLLEEIIKKPQMLIEMKNNCLKAKRNNLWICRAKTVEKIIHKSN